jgi:hypothetical protein
MVMPPVLYRRGLIQIFLAGVGDGGAPEQENGRRARTRQDIQHTLWRLSKNVMTLI